MSECLKFSSCHSFSIKVMVGFCKKHKCGKKLTFFQFAGSVRLHCVNLPRKSSFLEILKLSFVPYRRGGLVS